jgi:hypothetical protein
MPKFQYIRKSLVSALVIFLITSCSSKVYKSLPIEYDNNTITVKSSLDWMKESAKVANCVLNHAEFKAELALVESFDYSDDNGVQVLEKLSKVKCVASTYKTRNPFSKAIATTYATDKTTYYFNLRKNPRKMKYMVNTHIHECLHLAGYSHGDNSSIGKEKSVNYFVGSLGEKYSEKCESRKTE